MLASHWTPQILDKTKPAVWGIGGFVGSLPEPMGERDGLAPGAYFAAGKETVAGAGWEVVDCDAAGASAAGATGAGEAGRFARNRVHFGKVTGEWLRGAFPWFKPRLVATSE